MCSWKNHIHDALIGLLHTHGNAPLREIERILCAVLHVEEVRFIDYSGGDRSPDTPLAQAVHNGCDVIVRLHCAPPGQSVARGGMVSRSEPGESRFREGLPAAKGEAFLTDPRCTEFVREFLRLEQHHDFMWAGYVVRELLPRLGFLPEEAKLVLDQLRDEELVSTSKVPNPKNPNFPATGVCLNRDHPRVKALLEQMAAAHPPEPQPTESPT